MFFLWIGYPSTWAAALSVALYTVLAVVVTVDVLLKKSDVRSALGWIGAVWLAPLMGALLYFIFGINRVTRRAARLPRLDIREQTVRGGPAQPEGSPHIRTLAEAGRRITGAELAGGNRLSIFQGADEAYPAMLDAIANARSSVAMASYIFRNDAAGQEFATALSEAQRRGLEVRVLLDSVGTGYVFSLAYYRLGHAKVKVARFLHTWLPWRMPFLNMRNHRKLLVTDGKVAFMGGMNVGREYSQALAGKHGFVNDIHFRIEGPVARSVMKAFARDWNFTTHEVLEGAPWWPELENHGPVLARGLRSGPDADLYTLETLLGVALSLAKKRIRIVTPYFLPDQRLEFAIAQAVIRGVKVEIVIPERCDYRFLDWAMRAHLAFFRHADADVYLTPLPFDHSKLVSLDGEWSLIGSSNWDTRSFRLNFEYDLECYDGAFTRALDDIIDAKIAVARKLDSKELLSRPLLVRLRDAAVRLLVPYL